MGIKFSAYEGNLVADDGTRSSVWPPQRLASYGTDTAERLAADLDTTPDQFSGLDEALAALAPQLMPFAQAERDRVVQRAQQILTLDQRDTP